MSNHPKGPSKEFNKRGLTVTLKPVYGEDSEKVLENRTRALESAIRSFRKRTYQEGMTRDVKRKEFYESKGQIRRRRKNEAIRRERKNREKNEW